MLSGNRAGTRWPPHYDATDLERTPALEEAVFRIFLAQQRSASDLSIITALLQHWMADPPPQDGLGEAAHDVLDRLVVATQLRYPVVGDLARSARFRWFDQPIVQAARASVVAGVGYEVAYLAANPDAEGLPPRRLDALADDAGTDRGLPGRAPRARHPRTGAMLEVLAPTPLPRLRAARPTQHHGRRPPDRLRLHAGRPADLAGDDLARMPELVDSADPDSLVASVSAQLALAKEGHEGVVDLYLQWPEMPDAPDAASLHLQKVLGGIPFARRVRRVAVAVCPGAHRPTSPRTYRPGPDGVLEDHLVRGLHPMVGRRLDLWRLRDFDITRLDAPEDVLLYHAVATTPPTSGWWPWRRYASWRPCAMPMDT